LHKDPLPSDANRVRSEGIGNEQLVAWLWKICRGPLVDLRNPPGLTKFKVRIGDAFKNAPDAPMSLLGFGALCPFQCLREINSW